MKELPADATLRKRIWERLPGQLINLDRFFLRPRLHEVPPSDCSPSVRTQAKRPQGRLESVQDREGPSAERPVTVKGPSKSHQNQRQIVLKLPPRWPMGGGVNSASSSANGSQGTAQWSLRLLGGFELTSVPAGEQLA